MDDTQALNQMMLSDMDVQTLVVCSFGKGLMVDQDHLLDYDINERGRL